MKANLQFKLNLLSIWAKFDLKKSLYNLINDHLHGYFHLGYPLGYPFIFFHLYQQIIMLQHTYTLIDEFSKDIFADL